MGDQEHMNPVWVEKARHAILTGQPRLAELYMRRGLNECPDSRARLAASDAWRGVQAFARAVDKITCLFTEILGRFFAPVPEDPRWVFPHYTVESHPTDMMAMFRAEQHIAMQVRNPGNIWKGGGGIA